MVVNLQVARSSSRPMQVVGGGGERGGAVLGVTLVWLIHVNALYLKWDTVYSMCVLGLPLDCMPPPLLPLYLVLCKGMGLLRSISTCLYDK